MFSVKDMPGEYFLLLLKCNFGEFCSNDSHGLPDIPNSVNKVTDYIILSLIILHCMSVFIYEFGLGADADSKHENNGDILVALSYVS